MILSRQFNSQGETPVSRMQDGFTLLEVLIAVGILATGLVILLGSQSRSLTYAEEAVFNNRAPLLASIKRNELLHNGGLLSNATGEFENFRGYTWEVEVVGGGFGLAPSLVNFESSLEKIRLIIALKDTPYKYSELFLGRQGKQ